MVGFKPYEYVMPPSHSAETEYLAAIRKQQRDALHSEREGTSPCDLHGPWGSDREKLNEMTLEWMKYFDTLMMALLPADVTYGFYMTVPGPGGCVNAITQGRTKTELMIHMLCMKGILAAKVDEWLMSEYTNSDFDAGVNENDCDA